MRVAQAYQFVNQVMSEILGEENVVQEDLSNIVELGTRLEDAMGVENFIRQMNDVIGRDIFVNRVYSGRMPSILRDAWEYGSITRKTRMNLLDATENETWSLEDGEVYEQDQFYKANVSIKYFNNRLTFEIPMSIAERQAKSAFKSATDMTAFIGMIYTAIENSMTVQIDGLIQRAVNNAICETIYDEYEGGDLTAKSGVRAINLLYLYNEIADQDDQISDPKLALTDGKFLRYASMTIMNYVDRIKNMSKLFNAEGNDTFTPADRLHLTMLSEFRNAADVYLQADTWHNEMTKLPASDTVPYWQGSGTDFEFSNTSKIDVKTKSGHDVSVTGVLGIMFDRDAVGVSNLDRRTRVHVNDKAEFVNSWYKADMGLWNDLGENFVVFFIA